MLNSKVFRALRLTTVYISIIIFSAPGGHFLLRPKHSKCRKQISQCYYLYNYLNAVLKQSKSEINIEIMKFYLLTISLTKPNNEKI